MDVVVVRMLSIVGVRWCRFGIARKSMIVVGVGMRNSIGLL